MKVGELFLRYATTHVRMNAVGNTKGWTAREIGDAYAILPAPAIEFDQWIANLGEKVDPEAAPDQGVLPIVALKELESRGLIEPGVLPPGTVKFEPTVEINKEK